MPPISWQALQRHDLWCFDHVVSAADLARGSELSGQWSNQDLVLARNGQNPDKARQDAVSGFACELYAWEYLRGLGYPVTKPDGRPGVASYAPDLGCITVKSCEFGRYPWGTSWVIERANLSERQQSARPESWWLFVFWWTRGGEARINVYAAARTRALVLTEMKRDHLRKTKVAYYLADLNRSMWARRAA